MIRIKAAEALDGYWLRLTLSDGTQVDRNVRDLLRGPVFEPLRTDDALFRQVRVAWGTVTWPGDLDLDPSVLIWNGPRPRDAAARPAPRLELTHPLEATPA